MPYVLTQKLDASPYGDVIGQLYHLPARLSALLGGVQPGARFVYYRPKEGVDGRCFFGVGMIETVEQEPGGIFRLSLGAYQPFEAVVPKLLDDGAFAETGSASSPFYLWSVRFIADADVDRIVAESRRRAVG